MKNVVDAPKRDANPITHGLDLAEAARFDGASARSFETRLGREKAPGRPAGG